MEWDDTEKTEYELPKRMAWDADYVRLWKLRRERLRLAIAQAYVLKDAKAHLHRESVWPFVPEGSGIWATPCEMLYVGAPKTALARLRQGNLGIEDQLRPWTAEFFLGLKLAGALTEKEPYKFRINAKIYPELVADISAWHIAGRLGGDDGFGRRRLVGCLAASHLPVKDLQSDAVIAGLFAGARVSTSDGMQWLELPDDDAVKKLLENWTVLNYPSRQVRKRTYIKVSPFYAAFFAELMPAHSRQRMLSIRNPAMCPILPVMYWEWLFGPGMKGMRILPFADALPFGCSVRSFYRRGWQRKNLHRKAVLEYKILAVDFRLRVLMRKWFESHNAKRNGSSDDLQPKP